MRHVLALVCSLALVSLAGCGEDPPTGEPSEGGIRDGGLRPSEPPPTEGVIELRDPSGTGAPPAITAELVALTYIGGAGDQHVHAVRFEDDGTIVAEGGAFTVRYAADGSSGTVEGDVSASDDREVAQRPRLPGNPGQSYADARHGLVYTVGYRQADSVQLPIFRAFEGDTRLWTLWGHPVADVVAASLGADSRCYQAWAMPNGHVGVQCWTDGGNSVLAKDPRDLTTPGFDPSWAAGSFQRSAGGMSSLYARIDPTNGGSVVSGTFAASHVAQLAVDDWGRVYIGRVASSRSGGGDPENPFGQSESASSGLFVLEPELRQPVLNARIGGACTGDGNVQAFTSLAIREGILVAGGTTCAADLAVTANAVQAAHGGAHDAMIAIVRLWAR